MKKLIDSRSYPLSVSIRAARIYVLFLTLILVGTQGLDHFDTTCGSLLIFLSFFETIFVHYQQRLFDSWWLAFIIKEHSLHWTTKWFLRITWILLVIVQMYSLFLFIPPDTLGGSILSMLMVWIVLEFLARNIGTKLASIKYTDKSTYPHYQHYYTW